MGWGSERSDKNRDDLFESSQCLGKDSNRTVVLYFSVDLNLADKIIAFSKMSFTYASLHLCSIQYVH